MKLYINGQDIKSIKLAILNGESKIRSFAVEPDRFLHVLNGFLKDAGASVQDIEELYVVVGPGSATALRTSLAIANTFHYAKNVPLHGIEKSRETSDEKILEQVMSGTVQFIEHKNYLIPIYERGTGVVLSTKDALGRDK